MFFCVGNRILRCVDHLDPGACRTGGCEAADLCRFGRSFLTCGIPCLQGSFLPLSALPGLLPLSALPVLLSLSAPLVSGFGGTRCPEGSGHADQIAKCADSHVFFHGEIDCLIDEVHRRHTDRTSRSRDQPDLIGQDLPDSQAEYLMGMSSADLHDPDGFSLIVVDDFTCSRDHTCLIVTHWTVLPSFLSKQGTKDRLALLIIFTGDLCDRRSGMHHDVIAGHKIVKKLGRDLSARSGGVDDCGSVCLETYYSG